MAYKRYVSEVCCQKNYFKKHIKDFMYQNILTDMEYLRFSTATVHVL